MELRTQMPSESSSSLGMALVMSSITPLILLDERLVVQAASGSFCRSFSVDPDSVVGKELFALGDGEWDIPQLRSLMQSTASGSAAVDAYELELKRPDGAPRCLILNAHVLECDPGEALRVVLAVTDVTEARQAARDMEAVVHEKDVLLKEMSHRIANSLQIIASVLMQRVRRVQSEETRVHLRDAHHRVMAVATLQRQLASTAPGEVALRPYFNELCASIAASMIADPRALTMTVDVDDSVTTADRSVSLGLIVTELVINALKHAFPADDPKGAITVRFDTTGNGWSLAVTDDGVGMPADQDNTLPGLGTGIVKALAAQLSATVAVTPGTPGTIVSIVSAP